MDVIHVFSEYNTVNKGIVVKLYPDESMRDKINQNIGNARFTWNKLLQEYQETFELFKKQGYMKVSQAVCSRFSVTYYRHLIDSSTIHPVILDSNPKRIQNIASEYKTTIISKYRTI